MSCGANGGVTASRSTRLTAQIREAARRLGFFKMGALAARPLPRSREFDLWLQKGMQGEMQYLERQSAKRKDPALVLENVRSLLVLAMNYHSGHELSNDPLRGKISRYAWGGDYHLVTRDRLRRLADFIRQQDPKARCLYYVDTGPVMEKVWGAESGLGWMGKHSNLITRERGSWFFIGILLLDITLEYDVPEEDYCGTCTRCITACPTGAIVAPYVVDARLCVSYLTIELRGAVPRGLRPLMGNRIFGCDDCQEVCPWNRFASKTDEKEYYPLRGNLMPELARLVDLTPREFESRFAASAIRRATRDGFVRNVAVALGNARRPEAIPPLSRALHDASPLVRSHAAWALGQIAAGEALTLLEKARASEPDPQVIEEITLALGRSAPPWFRC